MSDSHYPGIILTLVWCCLVAFTSSNEGGIHADVLHCSHQPPTQDQVIHDVKVTSERHSIYKRSSFQPIRIHLHYDSSISNLQYSSMDSIKRLVEESVAFWERTLSVKRSNMAVRLNRQCITQNVMYKRKDRFCVNGCSTQTKCGDIYIPDDHLERCYFYDTMTSTWRSTMDAGKGVENTDFVLYVAALSTARCKIPRTIAYAAHCQQEFMLDRPIAGYFSICPDIDIQKSPDHTQMLSTIKHEILHALGFTAGLFAFYRDSLGFPLTPRNADSNKPVYNTTLQIFQWSDRVVRKVTRTRWRYSTGYYNREVSLLVTPRVVKEVRSHFGCDTLEGAELEDQGVLGTALTHWEKRIFENEAMTGTYTQNPVISRITLALMEDTGWYKANYNQAERLEWGSKLGCDFVKRSCMDWMETRRARYGDTHPFCETVRQGKLRTDCTQNRNAVAFCNLVQYQEPLPLQYQYFTRLNGVSGGMVNRYGGSVVLADYCPYLQEFTWIKQEKSVRDSRCSLYQNTPDPGINFYGENYGTNSVCLNHGFNSWYIQQCSRLIHVSHSGSGCYLFDCSSTNGLVLQIHDMSYQCLKKGQVLRVHYVSNHYLHRGTVICPSCNEVCKGKPMTCPAEREPYNIVTDYSYLVAPCRGFPTLNIDQCRQTIFISGSIFFLLLRLNR